MGLTDYFPTTGSTGLDYFVAGGDPSGAATQNLLTGDFNDWFNSQVGIDDPMETMEDQFDITIPGLEELGDFFEYLQDPVAAMTDLTTSVGETVFGELIPAMTEDMYDYIVNDLYGGESPFDPQAFEMGQADRDLAARFHPTLKNVRGQLAGQPRAQMAGGTPGALGVSGVQGATDRAQLETGGLLSQADTAANYWKNLNALRRGAEEQAEAIPAISTGANPLLDTYTGSADGGLQVALDPGNILAFVQGWGGSVPSTGQSNTGSTGGIF